ncbi:MAG TPA: 23S rRNA (uracil(1939)-C(5))-methyltransferase RlmD [Candidatus Binatia bacterium]|nr:23S rRNA (uracil(1939)-C(5))-methyltransferase RlmD [Candidatus Binatia bacterium]
MERKSRSTSKRKPRRTGQEYVPSGARDRFEAPCPHYPHCVGCPFINLPYPQQLSRKRCIVGRALTEYSSLHGVSVPPVVPSPERLGYRARVKLVVRRNRANVAIGLYVPRSHRVMDISSCPVHPRAVNQVVHYLKDKVVELGISPYDERDDSGDLRYLDFRYSAARQELSVTLVTRHGSFPQGEQLARTLMRRFSFVTGVIQNINEDRGNVIWGRSFRTLAGRDTLMERIGDLKLVLPPGVFSQGNPFTARKLYEHVLEVAALQGRETVLDLYCGIGPISLYLATNARQVWAIDDNELSVMTAKQNARRNGRGNCRFIAGDVATITTQLRETLSAVELIVLNPPRKGVQTEAMTAILAFNSPKLIYISCDPRSLARDLDRLVAANYRVERIQPFDMLPQTEEVETVALLVKK